MLLGPKPVLSSRPQETLRAQKRNTPRALNGGLWSVKGLDRAWPSPPTNVCYFLVATFDGQYWDS